VRNNLIPFGDFDRDHLTTAGDVQAMLNALCDLKSYQANNQLTNFELLAFGDINEDGSITNADVQEFLGLLAAGVDTGGGTGSLATVPEPASVILSAIGALMLVAGSRITASWLWRSLTDHLRRFSLKRLFLVGVLLAISSACAIVAVLSDAFRTMPQLLGVMIFGLFGIAISPLLE
jgi:hypothetical protein